MILLFVLDSKVLDFKCREIWFSQEPYDMEDLICLRFRGCRKRVELNGFSMELRSTPIIDLTQDTDTLWNNMDRSCCRYPIKRAERENIVIRINERYDEFIQLVSEIYVAKGLTDPCVRLDQIKDKGILFTAEISGEVVGAQFHIFDDYQMRWLYSASKRLKVDKEMASLISAANKYLLWSAIKHAKEKGLAEFDLGGVFGESYAEGSGVNAFKLKFGSVVVPKYEYQKYYSNLVKLADYSGLLMLTDGYRRKFTRKYPWLPLHSGRSP